MKTAGEGPVEPIRRDPERVVDKPLVPKKKKRKEVAKHARHIHNVVRSGPRGAEMGNPGRTPETPYGVDRNGTPYTPKSFVPRSDLRDANLSYVEIGNMACPESDFSNANMRKIRIEKANLYRASLRGVDLYGADLTRVNFKEADLSYANLTGASLVRADLSRANLTGADLSGANCRGARFQEADLTEAILSEADFPMAFFRKAFLGKAILHRTNLGGANLFEAILENCSFRDTYYTDETIKPERTYQWPPGTVKKKIVRRRDD